MINIEQQLPRIIRDVTVDSFRQLLFVTVSKRKDILPKRIEGLFQTFKDHFTVETAKGLDHTTKLKVLSMSLALELLTNTKGETQFTSTLASQIEIEKILFDKIYSNPSKFLRNNPAGQNYWLEYEEYDFKIPGVIAGKVAELNNRLSDLELKDLGLID